MATGLLGPDGIADVGVEAEAEAEAGAGAEVGVIVGSSAEGWLWAAVKASPEVGG